MNTLTLQTFFILKPVVFPQKILILFFFTVVKMLHYYLKFLNIGLEHLL